MRRAQISDPDVAVFAAIASSCRDEYNATNEPSYSKARGLTQMAKPETGDKSKALELALSSIRKQYGDGSVMKLGEEPLRLQVSVISTGALSLDIALGVGGLP